MSETVKPIPKKKKIGIPKKKKKFKSGKEYKVIILKNCENCGVEYTHNVFSRYYLKMPDICNHCRQTKHGHAARNKRKTGRSREYSIWHGMRTRVYTTTDKDYREGTKLYPGWESFEGFKEWCDENNYNPEIHQLRRKDPKGHFEPDNCHFIVRPLNKYLYRGEMRYPKEIYEMLGSKCASSYKIFRRRLSRGEPINRAIMEPARVNQFTYAVNAKRGNADGNKD